MSAQISACMPNASHAAAAARASQPPAVLSTQQVCIDQMTLADVDVNAPRTPPLSPPTTHPTMCKNIHIIYCLTILQIIILEVYLF